MTFEGPNVVVYRPNMESSEPRHEAILSRARRLQHATIAWNLMEVVVTVGLGIAAASLALIAFGLDSLVEVFASLVVIRFIDEHHDTSRARKALKLVALAFGILALYLVAATVYNVVQGDRADSSPLGIAYLAVTACVMFGLAHVKRRVATAVSSAPLAAEARMTFLDGCLASGIFVSLLLNTLWSLWWADPAAAVLVAGFCAREALDNWRDSATATAVAYDN